MRFSMLEYWRWFLIGNILMCIFISYANANEYAHQHPPQDQAIHEKFYSTWMMPDNRTVSCCNKRDCSPAETYWLNGHWMAHKVDDLDKRFVPIPEAKVEMERDNPDGRSHLCGARSFPSGDFTVYCFIAGTGG